MKLEIKDVLGSLITAAAILLGVRQYKATTYDEFLRPVRETQLKLYQETSDTAAMIATLPRGSSEQEKSRRDFLRLYYGSLVMVEDFDHGPREDPSRITAKKAIDVFKVCLEREDCKDDSDALHKLSLALAHACRESLRRSWRYKLEEPPSNEYEEIIRNYQKRFQKGMG